MNDFNLWCVNEQSARFGTQCQFSQEVFVDDDIPDGDYTFQQLFGDNYVVHEDEKYEEVISKFDTELDKIISQKLMYPRYLWIATYTEEELEIYNLWRVFNGKTARYPPVIFECSVDVEPKFVDGIYPDFLLPIFYYYDLPKNYGKNNHDDVLLDREDRRYKLSDLKETDIVVVRYEDGYNISVKRFREIVETYQSSCT